PPAAAKAAVEAHGAARDQNLDERVFSVVLHITGQALDDIGDIQHALTSPDAVRDLTVPGQALLQMLKRQLSAPSAPAREQNKDPQATEPANSAAIGLAETFLHDFATQLNLDLSLAGAAADFLRDRAHAAASHIESSAILPRVGALVDT